jgi:hypothetical protein
MAFSCGFPMIFFGLPMVFQTSKGHGVPPARWPPSASLPAPALGGAALVSREAAHAGASKAMDVGC